MANENDHISEALKVLSDLDMPRAQLNERSALCLLALINLRQKKSWADAEAPLMGITPIMEWAKQHYGKNYAPNTRETFRRQTMHQFIEAGIALYNPDEPGRPVNSPNAVYQIESTCLALLKSVGSKAYELRLKGFNAARIGLAAKYAKHREMKLIPVEIGGGKQIALSPGVHSELIRQIIEEFGARFVPGGQLVYCRRYWCQMGLLQ